MKLAIDSSILVSGLDPKDVHHAECRPIFQKLLAAEIESLCPVTVLVETVCAIRRRTTDSLLAQRVCAGLSRLPSINWLA